MIGSISSLDRESQKEPSVDVVWMVDSSVSGRSRLASVTVAQPAVKMMAKAMERTFEVRDFIKERIWLIENNILVSQSQEISRELRRQFSDGR